MMKRSMTYCLALALMMAMACTSDSGSVDENSADYIDSDAWSESDRLAKIDELTAALFTKKGEGKELMSDSIAALLESHYNGFVEQFASHEKAPGFLELASRIARNQNDYDRVFAYYDRILDEYSETDKARQVLFLKANLHDQLGHKEEAETLYRTFIERYPDDSFADDSKNMLKLLNMSDEEIIEQLKAGKLN